MLIYAAHLLIKFLRNNHKENFQLILFVFFVMIFFSFYGRDIFSPKLYFFFFLKALIFVEDYLVNNYGYTVSISHYFFMNQEDVIYQNKETKVLTPFFFTLGMLFGVVSLYFLCLIGGLLPATHFNKHVIAQKQTHKNKNLNTTTLHLKKKLTLKAILKRLIFSKW